MKYIPTLPNFFGAFAITLSIFIMLLILKSLILKVMNLFGVHASLDIYIPSWVLMLAIIVTHIVIYYGFKLEFVMRKRSIEN